MRKAFTPGSNDLLATIEAVHAAGLDAQLWPQVLAAVAETVGGRAATFEVFDKLVGLHREFYSYGVPPVAEIAYFEHFIADNPPRLFMPRQQTGDIGCDYRFIDEKGMNKAPFYAELLTQMDLRYFLSGVLVATADDYACISVQRSARQGHVEQDEIRLMKRLLPHVQQAFDVAQRLKGVCAANKSFEQAFDWIADGVAFVATTGAVIYSNEALRAMVRRNDIVRMRKNAIEFFTVDARTRFDAALGAVQRLQAGEQPVPATMDFPVRRRAPDVPLYIVSVHPLVRTSPDCQAAVCDEAIVFIRDPLKRGNATSYMLREVFGLTETEASVAMALTAGVALPH